MRGVRLGYMKFLWLGLVVALLSALRMAACVKPMGPITTARIAFRRLGHPVIPGGHGSAMRLAALTCPTFGSAK